MSKIGHEDDNVREEVQRREPVVPQDPQEMDEYVGRVLAGEEAEEGTH
jgi:hypothetical protein